MTSNKNKYLLPLILVTSLFFLWGLAYGLLDVLNKHFQEALNITKQRSMLLQMAYFGAYFLVALPAGYFMQKAGYKKGIIVGLLLYASGAILFYPSAESASFLFFLVALFILASGLAFLETAANPYITVLGDPGTAAFRLNLSQSFNGVGSFFGPIIGGALFFSGDKPGVSTDLGTVKFVYLAIAAIVLLVALLFFRTRLPEIREEPASNMQREGESDLLQGVDQRPLFKYSNFTWAVAAQFFYVAAQVGIAALFINYCTERGVGISNERASYLLSGAMLLFTIGRFVGTAIMKYISPSLLLGIYAIINMILCAIVMQVEGMVSIYSLMLIFFFESIMFPTIFALGVQGLGRHTKRASSFIIMSIVGGALVPLLMGWLAGKYSTAFSYIIPLGCFAVVLLFALKSYKTNNAHEKILSRA